MRNNVGWRVPILKNSSGLTKCARETRNKTFRENNMFKIFATTLVPGPKGQLWPAQQHRTSRRRWNKMIKYSRVGNNKKYIICKFSAKSENYKNWSTSLQRRTDLTRPVPRVCQSSMTAPQLTSVSAPRDMRPASSVTLARAFSLCKYYV